MVSVDYFELGMKNRLIPESCDIFAESLEALSLLFILFCVYSWRKLLNKKYSQYIAMSRIK